jgi:hypothetical protein
MAVTVVALLGYAACGAWALGIPPPGSAPGLPGARSVPRCGRRRPGPAARAKLSYPAEQVTGLTFLLLAVAATVTAGILAARQIRTARATWQAGLFSGLVSGIALYAFGVIITLSTLPILASRSDYRAQFAHSHAPDIATYLVGDVSRRSPPT